MCAVSGASSDVPLHPLRVPTPNVCRDHHLLSVTTPPSHNVWRQHVAREVEAAFDQLFRALEGAVLVLDADDAIISGGVECRYEAIPAHLAQTGQAGDFPAEAAAEDAILVEHLAVDLQILGVNVEQAVPELGDWPHLVDELPDQVRGVVVEPEILVRDDLEHASPDSG